MFMFLTAIGAALGRHARRASTRFPAAARTAAAAALPSRRSLSMATVEVPRAADIPDISNLECQFDSFVFDLDGVILQGGVLIDGVAGAIAHLQANGKRVFFMSNNSTKSRRMYAEKLRKLGLNVDSSNVVNSASATAEYLAEQLAAKGQALDSVGVYVLGGPGVREELTNVGISFHGPEDDLKTFDDLDFDGDDLRRDGTSIVVCGLDHRAGYYKLCKAAAYIRYNGAQFVATNGDACGPFFPNLLCPGCGAQVAHVTTASGKEPDVIIGKPSQALANLLVSRFGLDPQRSLMVGDRLDTDILFGHRGGMATLLVYSGVMQPEDVAGVLEKQKAELGTGLCYPPTFTAKSVASLATLRM